MEQVSASRIPSFLYERGLGITKDEVFPGGFGDSLGTFCESTSGLERFGAFSLEGRLLIGLSNDPLVISLLTGFEGSAAGARR